MDENNVTQIEKLNKEKPTMKELIDKSAVVAEIKKLRKRAYELYGCSQFDTAYNNVLESIDTLEVKEVDLAKEYKEFIDCDNGRSMFEIAKHFFELGLKSQKGN